MSKDFKILLSVFILSLFFWWSVDLFSEKLGDFFFVKEITKNPEVFAASLILEKQLEDMKPFAKKESQGLNLGAKSAMSILIKNDGSSKIIFDKEKSQKLPIASLTKLMTALVVLENHNPSDSIHISNEAAFEENEYGQGNLKISEEFKVKDLLYVLLMESSNGAAVAFADSLGNGNFVELMNKTAERLGLQGTFFTNPSGLDPDNPADLINYSTAEDLADLGSYLLITQPLVWEIVSKSEFDIYLADGIFFKKLKNTNELLHESANWSTQIVGGKTGWTPRAKGCLLIVYKAPNEKGFLINVVLGSEDRFGDMKKLINWTEESYNWK